MSRANPLWGAPRIHGELLKLGIAVAQSTLARYLPRPANLCLAKILSAENALEISNIQDNETEAVLARRSESNNVTLG